MFRFFKRPISKPQSLAKKIFASISRDEAKEAKAEAKKAAAPVASSVTAVATTEATAEQKARIAQLEKDIATAKAARDTRANAATEARREEFIRQVVRKFTPAQGESIGVLYDTLAKDQASAEALQKFFAEMPDHGSLSKIPKRDIPKAIQQLDREKEI